MKSILYIINQSMTKVLRKGIGIQLSLMEFCRGNLKNDGPFYGTYMKWKVKVVF